MDWTAEANTLYEHIFEALKASVKDGLSAGKVGFSQTVANEQAAAWARQYAATLANQVNATSQRLALEAVADWTARPGATIGELTEETRKKLVEAIEAGMKVNASRASSIAVTEVTRAYAEGNRIAYTQDGVKQWRWRTNRDDLTCSICGPLNGTVKRIGENFGEFNKRPFTQPPAHPNCRCWVTPVVDEESRLSGPSAVESAGSYDQAFLNKPASIGSGATDLEIIRHFQDRYDVNIDLLSGNSMTAAEVQMTDKVLGSLPQNLVKKNARFSELALSDSYHIDDYYPDGTLKPENERGGIRWSQRERSDDVQVSQRF
jgi:SPP1 gp7 family putative phage head morphogenesis protein